LLDNSDLSTKLVKVKLTSMTLLLVTSALEKEVVFQSKSNQSLISSSTHKEDTLHMNHPMLFLLKLKDNSDLLIKKDKVHHTSTMLLQAISVSEKEEEFQSRCSLLQILSLTHKEPIQLMHHQMLSKLCLLIRLDKVKLMSTV
jgi:hypothetical protein